MILKQKPQIVHCFYKDAYVYFFWLGSTPAGYENLASLVPRGHPLRIGVGAVSECPKTMGEARQKNDLFKSRLPPPSR
jgi:hypothetical protein